MRDFEAGRLKVTAHGRWLFCFTFSLPVFSLQPIHLSSYKGNNNHSTTGQPRSGQDSCAADNKNQKKTTCQDRERKGWSDI